MKLEVRRALDWEVLTRIAVRVVSLALLLVYNFVHTGQLLSSYIQPQWIGFAAALGIELSVVELSWQIGRQRKADQGARFFYVVLVAVLLVSAMANAAEGFHTRYGLELDSRTVLEVNWVRLFIDISATALISLIVLSLAEILGTEIPTLPHHPVSRLDCPHCNYAVRWPTDRWPDETSARRAMGSHSRVHNGAGDT